MQAAGLQTKTTCPYCGVGCGVLAERQPDGSVSIKGDPEHPANFGRLCSKGSALAETIGLEDRLLHPEVHGHRTGWDEALDLVAEKFSQAIAEHGPDSVAFYVSGQLLTEDYYVANKLMKGFIGSANIDTNSRLCMASSVAGHRRAFGADTVPGTYEDLELADLVVLTGSNLAWCHPVLYQRLAAAREKRPEMKVVLIDPRRTMTADIADLHLAIAPDGDTALFAGLLCHLADCGIIARDYVEKHTNGFNEALAAVQPFDVARVAAETGLPPGAIETFYRLFAERERTVTVYSQGVNQSAAGTDKVNAILNCHLATGRIGRPGMGPFSVTGQPNAMGGREVGGLANMLAAHMDLENAFHRERVQRFWGAPRMADKPGLKAVEMFKAVGAGRIKALWIMATNPVDSLPEADAVEAALTACPFVVVSDVAAVTDTLRHAHVKLPSTAWGEKAGTVTNSERRISRQRTFLSAPGGARSDWWQIVEVARRMGFGAAFDYGEPVDIFREHAALSALENEGTRDFDIGAYAEIKVAEYGALRPFQWPVRREEGEADTTTTVIPEAEAKHRLSGMHSGTWTSHGMDPGSRSLRSLVRDDDRRGKAGDTRFFADGGFFTPDRRARFVAVSPSPRRVVNSEFPLVLNTGRVRDHWHTMTRTGKSARLSGHMAEPYAEIHPADATDLGIGEADLVHVESRHGGIIVRALISERQRRGSVFVPMHWTDQFSAKGRVDTLVAQVTDPVSGQPASKNVAVRLRPFAARFYGFAVSVARPVTGGLDYWAVARCMGGWRAEIAHGALPEGAEAVLRRLLALPQSAQVIAYHDERRSDHRMAAFDGERLLGALYLSPEPVAVSRGFAVEQLGIDHPDPRGRFRVVAGRAGADRPDIGAIVCSCFGVGANQIATAARQGCTSVEAIGRTLYAGTNCGSCRAEIRGIVEVNRAVAAE
ncbi:molybdopterin-dependent oxidoreductase [Chelativorans sp. M5D2P16]|uniref:nitrate reductase n=1 Tax=Chelativorans sp. M5D2P16 TaxID=3095678 RepID=UPI002ACADD48|nr:molybdopterin-dependent oxidoreductase [Chelativorans sp. M5D2P16]MDZ5698299.1 molybdopterin-dependent oxidoreductase [Chelativorans sp. M5D2P16]